MATKASRIALAGSNISSTGEVDADLLDNIDSTAFLSLDSNGRLGIGTSSPISQLHVNKDVAGHNTDGITLGKVESAGWIDVNEEMGRLSWSASYGSSYTPGIGAYISAKADANWDGTETPTRLGFFTAPEGSTTPVEHMRINSLGNVGIGTSSMEAAAAAIKVEVESGSNYRPMRLRFADDNNGSTNNPLSFEYKAGLEIENIYSGAAPSANGTKIAKLSLTTVTSSGYGATGSIFVTTNAGTGHNSGELAFAVGHNSSGLETEAMRINKDGNIGIGTNDPKRPLQIGATGSFPISFNGNYPDIHMNTYYESGWRIHTAGFGAKTTFNGATGAFGFSNVASSQSAGATFTPLERLTILANGNVGINNNNPAELLHLKKSSGAPILRLEAPGSELARIELGDGSNYTHISSRPDMGDGLLFYENGANNTVMRGGKVGIGTTNPQRPLHIVGNSEVLRITSSGATDSHTDFHIDSNEFSIRIDDDNVKGSSVFTLDIDADEKMRIDEYGDMALGSTTAYSTLYVKGGSGSATKKNLTTFATSNLGGSQPDLDTASIVLGSYAGRTASAGNYIAGIAFDHLLNHQSAAPFNYGQNPHAWLGLKMWDFPGYERASLIFATREVTTSASAPTIERMEITPYGNVGINRATPPTTLTVNGTQRIEIDSNPSGLYADGTDMHRDGAIIFPVTATQTTQQTDAGTGWASMGWATTARSGEQMHRQTGNRYMNGGSGTAMGFYIEAGTGEAGGVCLDEDSVQVYGSSDNGTTFRIIDKDSDIVIMEMLQSSWNMSVRGSVNSNQSSFSGLSDRRVKKAFQDVSTENILTKYNNLDLKSYIRIDSYDYMKDNYENEEDLREIGLVAQEVEEIFPDVVGTTPVVDPRGMDSVWEELGEELTEIKNINQTGLLYKTIEAVQALIEENTALKARLDALEE